MADSRLDREKAFHDREFSEGARHVVDKFYSVTRGSRELYEQYLADHADGSDVLEYGCGLRNYAVYLAQRGSRVTAIDLSDEAIRQSQERAREAGFDAIDFRAMNAEQLELADDSFDLVCGEGILHHLDLDRAFAEVARVLRPGGSAIFIEPLGHNPVINLYRSRTPSLRTPDEHPLLLGDFDVARRYFGAVDPQFFHLQALAAVPFRDRGFFGPLLGGLEAADRTLFRAVPYARRFAWQVVLRLAAPR